MREDWVGPGGARKIGGCSYAVLSYLVYSECIDEVETDASLLIELRQRHSHGFSGQLRQTIISLSSPSTNCGHGSNAQSGILFEA